MAKFKWLKTTGSAEIGGSISVGSNIDIAGQATISGATSFSGDISIGGNLDTSGDAAVLGDLDVKSNVSVDGTMETTGLLTASGGLKFVSGQGDTYISGSSKLKFGTSVGENDAWLSMGGIVCSDKQVPNDNVTPVGIFGRKTTQSGGANGIGGSFEFELQNSAGTIKKAGEFQWIFEDATSGSEDTNFIWKALINNAMTDVLKFSGGKWQFYGGLDQINVTNVNVSDKAIRLNVGGTAGSSEGAGLFIEEDGEDAGYLKIGSIGATTRSAFLFKKPNEASSDTELKIIDLNSNSAEYNFGSIIFTATDKTAGSEDSEIIIKNSVNGSMETAIKFGATETLIPKTCKYTSDRVFRHSAVGNVTYTTQSANISLPSDGVIVNIYCYVSEAFNDTGTDLLDIGISGSQERYAANIDVSTTGWKTLTLSNVPDINGSSVLITYTGENTNATAGKAYVIVDVMQHSLT